jgi:hypothetical protein
MSTSVVDTAAGSHLRLPVARRRARIALRRDPSERDVTAVPTMSVSLPQ